MQSTFLLFFGGGGGTCPLILSGPILKSGPNLPKPIIQKQNEVKVHIMCNALLIQYLTMDKDTKTETES